jgi:hypothetical protein
LKLAASFTINASSSLRLAIERVLEILARGIEAVPALDALPGGKFQQRAGHGRAGPLHVIDVPAD